MARESHRPAISIAALKKAQPNSPSRCAPLGTTRRPTHARPQRIPSKLHARPACAARRHAGSLPPRRPLRILDGQETTPGNPDLQFLQTNRIAQRLVGNFGFSNAQRSFDGANAHYGGKTYDLTAMAARADQGVFNMNANPELTAALQYLAFSKYDFNNRFLWRVFAMDYHDGRTGLTKTDNRSLAIRQTDHKNIRLGSYGADFVPSMPAGAGKFDLLAWGVLQNGQWGLLRHRAGAIAVEAGYHATQLRSSPWLRAGFLRSTGDNNPTDGQHNTFFQVLPTPRVYARFPFYNMMNSKDQFLQLMDKSSKHLALCSELHFLQLASNRDLWYQGGGAFDNKVFGFVGPPANLHSSFASVADVLSTNPRPRSLCLLRARLGQKCRCRNLSRWPHRAVRLSKWGVQQRPSK